MPAEKCDRAFSASGPVMRTNPQSEEIYNVFPPRLGDGVEVIKRIQGDSIEYILKPSDASRYFRIKSAEYRVLQQLDGSQTVGEVCNGGRSNTGPRVSPRALSTFLAKLDSLGLLARGGAPAGPVASNLDHGAYYRIRLLDPDALLSWADRRFRWALSRPFVSLSFILMFVAALEMLRRSDEVAAYSSYIYARYGLLAVIVVTVTITAFHELAHGLACKHFGGRVDEIGVMLIYRVIPAFYCNVSDIYRFPRKRERLWVIMAGVYWQLAVSATSALIWLASTPYTVLSDLAFLLVIGGTLNVVLNCNPLIKLDGYYALSQLVGVPNLKARSAAYARSLSSRLLGGPPLSDYDPRPLLYLSYWLASIVYSLVLVVMVLIWAGTPLIDQLGLLGVFLTIAIAFLLCARWLKAMLAGAERTLSGLIAAIRYMVNSVAKPLRRRPARNHISSEGATTMSAQTALQQASPADAAKIDTIASRLPARRRILNAAVAVMFVGIMIAPWEASTGSDCSLQLPPGREDVARANTDAVLAEIYVQPGDSVAEGARLVRLTNPEIEDRLTELNGQLTSLEANAARIEEELRVRSELLLSSSFKEVDQKRLANELKDESSQIADWNATPAKSPAVSRDLARQPSTRTSLLPPALAVLESEIELKQTELEHNRREVERYRHLLDQGLVGEQLYDRAVAAMKISEKEIQGAKARLDGAMVDHRRLTTGAMTSSLVAETEARAARSSFQALIAGLHENRQQLEAFRLRRDILQREHDGMSVVAPRSGVILGEDLRRMVGRRYGRGEEICRIGELEVFLLTVEVSEREIGDVRLDSPVRFKLKTIPGRTFTGRVAKINAEAATNQYGQRFYPVEVYVENSDGLLRPGMTGFARISFGHQSIGLILAQKLWNALRPELWLF
jgi:putative peptide zinc metalloprotease protein